MYDIDLRAAGFPTSSGNMGKLGKQNHGCTQAFEGHGGLSQKGLVVMTGLSWRGNDGIGAGGTKSQILCAASGFFSHLLMDVGYHAYR